MKILVIADTPPKQSLKELAYTEKVNLICTLGDLDIFALEELRDITDIPKIGVYGNHCTGQYFDSLGIENLHLKTKTIEGVTFGGFEGSLRYKPNPRAIMYTQDEAREMIRDFPKVDVMIAHSPPYGIHDEPGDLTHEGLHALKDYIEEKQPRYFLHGHTHPALETALTPYKQTNVVFIFGERVIII